MAAITPSTVTRINLGNANLVVAQFTTVSDTDTWASGIPAVVAQWTHGNGNPSTQTSAGVDSTFSSGTVTFYPSENSLAATWFGIIE